MKKKKYNLFCASTSVLSRGDEARDLHLPEHRRVIFEQTNCTLATPLCSNNPRRCETLQVDTACNLDPGGGKSLLHFCTKFGLNSVSSLVISWSFSAL